MAIKILLLFVFYPMRPWGVSAVEELIAERLFLVYGAAVLTSIGTGRFRRGDEKSPQDGVVEKLECNKVAGGEAAVHRLRTSSNA